jgi:glycerol-3-phosphate cytidylyltransferase
MENKLKKGFTCGAMDLLHAGHVLMLKECKKYCDYLIVGLHTNPQLDRADKNKPIQSLIERYHQLEGCAYVDQIIPYETESDLIEILKSLDYDVRFVGSDWEGKEFTGFDINGHLDKVVYNVREHDYSSSGLRKRIANAENK